MATEKTPNYTPEQAAELVAAYVANPVKETVDIFAEKWGKSTRSIVAKLSREGVYKPKEYVTKTGEKPVKKEALADTLGELVGLSEPETDSLAKVNKTALQKIISRINSDAEMIENTGEELRNLRMSHGL